MGGDGGGGRLEGEVGLEESLVICEGLAIVPRPLACAETCVSTRTGVDKYRRGTRFVASLEKEFECSL